MAHPAPGTGHAQGHDDHHDLGSTFRKVFVALCVLTAFSFLFGNIPWSDPRVGWALMMAVSCAKAMLVISFFMHLKWEANWKYVLTIPASIMSVFLVLMLVPDVVERGKYVSEERSRYMAPAEADHEHGHADETAEGAAEHPAE